MLEVSEKLPRGIERLETTKLCFFNQFEGSYKLEIKYLMVQELSKYCSLNDDLKVFSFLPFSYAFETNNDYSFTEFVRQHYKQEVLSD